MNDESPIASIRERIRRRRGDDDSPALVLSEDAGYVGDALTFHGRGLEPNGVYEIVWHSQEGDWAVVGASEVVGPQYQPRRERVATVTADESGEFDEEWEIPEDFGGSHRVELRDADGGADADGETVADATYEITPWFELERTEAPLGESFTVRGYGIGPDVVTSNYQVTWDNSPVGLLTGVMRRGTATAEIRAVGPPGDHVLQVWRNAEGIPYLQNNTQSPYGPVAGGRQSAWTVEVTEPDGDPRTAWVDPLLDESPIAAHYPDIDGDSDATIELSPTSGQPGTTAFVTGENFPPDTEVNLRWYRHEGFRGEGVTVTPEPDPDVLPSATTDEKGRFQTEVAIPRDQGSTRPITAAVDGREVAVAGFVMQPAIETFVPTRGPVGTTIEIELTGIGWTDYENQLFFVYDNKPVGYAVGTTGADEPGTVRVELKATGEPGWHFVDVYPSLLDMREDTPTFDSAPHLSYVDNHPMRPVPAVHFAFEVTEA